MGSFQLEFNSWEEIMIAKITLVSMLAAVAIARPEADPQFYHHGVVGHVHPTCENGADVLPVQSCAPRTEDACVTSDVMSQEIIYVKKCQNVVSKTCAPVIVKRSAEAEPEAEADPQYFGYGGHYGYAAPVTYALPEIKPKPSRLPALSTLLNIALMSPKSKRLSLLSKPAMSLQRLTAPPLNIHCPRLPAKLAKPKSLISLPLMLAANKFQLVFLIAIQIYKYKEFFQS